jgi:hypothetical protein
MHVYITVLNKIKYNVCLLSYTHHISLRHVSAVYGHHQVGVSSAKTVSLYAVVCITLLCSMLIFEVVFVEITIFSSE